jgi:hypothetical protein
MPAPENELTSPWRENVVNEMVRPFVRLWNYVDQVGGFPGQIFFVVTCVMLVIGFLTWYGNKK